MASSSSSSSKPSKPGDAFVGSFISLISKSEIRYEGVLYHLDEKDATIGLRNVRSYGTEGRKEDGAQIPSSEKVYDYILFRGSDIKDLKVKNLPRVQDTQSILDDPAIIQTHYSGPPTVSSLSASIDGKTSAESAQGQEMYNLSGRPYFAGSASLSHATENSGQFFSTPSYWQGHSGTSNSVPHAAQHYTPFQTSSVVTSPLSVQNQIQKGIEHNPVTRLTNTPEFDAPIPSFVASMPPQHWTPIQPSSVVASPLSVQNQIQQGLEHSPLTGLTNAPEFVAPVPSFGPPLPFIGSDFLQPNVTTSTSLQYSAPHDMLPSSPANVSFPSYSGYTSFNRLNTPSALYSTGDACISNSQNIGEVVSDPRTLHSVPCVPHPVSPHGSSSSGPLLTASPRLSPEQVAPSRSPVLSSASSTSPSSIPLALLLPSPSSVQKFTEAFDFEAMNEKFNKDEVWDYLGKVKQRDKTQGTQGNKIDQSLEDRDRQTLDPVTDSDAKPAYKKDDFFDTISCASLNRGRTGQNRYNNRMRQETQTFGSNGQRRNMGHGSSGPERNSNYDDGWTGYRFGRAYNSYFKNQGRSYWDSPS